MMIEDGWLTCDDGVCRIDRISALVRATHYGRAGHYPAIHVYIYGQSDAHLTVWFEDKPYPREVEAKAEAQQRVWSLSREIKRLTAKASMAQNLNLTAGNTPIHFDRLRVEAGG
jgi:hypothetical protein